MKTYRVVIEETVSDEFEIEADSEEDAIDRAISEYNEGNFVVGPNVTFRQISIVEDDEFKNWIEF